MPTTSQFLGYTYCNTAKHNDYALFHTTCVTYGARVILMIETTKPTLETSHTSDDLAAIISPMLSTFFIRVRAIQGVSSP